MSHHEQLTNHKKLFEKVFSRIRILQIRLLRHRGSWHDRFYFPNGQHRGEEVCRDEIIKILEDGDSCLNYEVEYNVSGGGRADVVVSPKNDANLILPIEIKGQWNEDIWTAPDDQLGGYMEKLGVDFGVFLALWFGDDADIPQDPCGEEDLENFMILQERLRNMSDLYIKGQIEISVIDLTKP